MGLFSGKYSAGGRACWRDRTRHAGGWGSACMSVQSRRQRRRKGGQYRKGEETGKKEREREGEVDLAQRQNAGWIGNRRRAVVSFSLARSWRVPLWKIVEILGETRRFPSSPPPSPPRGSRLFFSLLFVAPPHACSLPCALPFLYIRVKLFHAENSGYSGKFMPVFGWSLSRKLFLHIYTTRITHTHTHLFPLLFISWSLREPL